MSSERSLGPDLTPLPPSPATTVVASGEHLGAGEGGRPSLVRSAPIDREKLELARRFRRAPTRAEAAAWALLRNRSMLGLKFRRQQIIAGFIADFFCSDLALVLEIDGPVHDDVRRGARDKLRADFFESIGLRVLRIRNEDVSRAHLQAALSRVIALPPLLRRDAHRKRGR